MAHMTTVIKRRIANLQTPAFVINKFAFERNCQTMLEMAKEKGLLLRPHVKTHKTAQGARIQAANDDANECSCDWVCGFHAPRSENVGGIQA